MESGEGGGRDERSHRRTAKDADHERRGRREGRGSAYVGCLCRGALLRLVAVRAALCCVGRCARRLLTRAVCTTHGAAAECSVVPCLLEQQRTVRLPLRSPSPRFSVRVSVSDLEKLWGASRPPSELLMMEVKRLRSAATRAHVTSRTTRGGAAADTSTQGGEPMREVARVAETLESLAATNASWGGDDAAHQKALDAMSAQMAAMAEQVLLPAPIQLALPVVPGTNRITRSTQAQRIAAWVEADGPGTSPQQAKEQERRAAANDARRAREAEEEAAAAARRASEAQVRRDPHTAELQSLAVSSLVYSEFIGSAQQY